MHLAYVDGQVDIVEHTHSRDVTMGSVKEQFQAAVRGARVAWVCATNRERFQAVSQPRTGKIANLIERER